MENLAVPKSRIQSIDLLRGIVMLIMAIDHVRDFFHITAMTADPLDLKTTTLVLFFTRWITHFCAPIFVFLSGTSAFLASQRKSPKQTGLFLFKRGVWLILVEVVVITLGLTFNPLYNIIILQVIWAIGSSMILLALFSFTNIRVIAVIGFILVFGHDILNTMSLPKEGVLHSLVSLFITTSDKVIPLDKTHFIFDFYSVLPWTGIMFLGYAFGTVYKSNPIPERRRKKIFLLGLAVTLFFIVLRYTNVYGDPSPWSLQRNSLYTLLSFVNVSKYPPSLLYSCLTIGIALMLLSVVETAQNRASRVFQMYGRVPFFYYVLHFYIIHTLLVIFFFASGFGSKDIINPQAPFLFRPTHFGYNLLVVYLIWFFVIIVLYKPCKWFDKYRRTHHQWWLSYL